MSTVHRIVLFAPLVFMVGTGAAQGPKVDPPKFDPAALFRRADGNGDLKLSKDEFTKLTSAFPKARANPDLPAKWFDYSDADQDGGISLGEFRFFVTPAVRRGNLKNDTPQAAPGPAQAPTAEQLAFFEKKIRPVLLGNCAGCHSAEKNKLRGGLALDSIAGLLQGGDSGPAVVPGKPAESLLLTAIRHTHPDLKMPPNEQLAGGVVADFEAWVRMGAPAPKDANANAAGAVLGGLPPEQRSKHRSVYLPILRGSPLEALALFDGVDGSVGVGRRNETVIPAQSLYLLNSLYVLKLAGAAASRLAQERADETGRVRRAYLRWFGRPATGAEVEAALTFIHDYRDRAGQTRTARLAESEAWTAFCQALWASGDFLLRR